jgi:acetoacetate decarboxylase
MLQGYTLPLSPRGDREPGDEAAVALCRGGGRRGVLDRPAAAAATFPRLAAGQQDNPAVHELVMALFDDQTITNAWTGSSKLEFPEVPGEELHDPAPVRAGAGFRFELAYTVTDLRTLK